VVLQILKSLIRVRFLVDNYVWDFRREDFIPTQEHFDPFRVGRVVYVSPTAARFMRPRECEKIQVWEPAEILGVDGTVITVKLRNGCTFQAGNDWFYPYPPDW